MILSIRVKPNARTSALVRADDGSWSASLRSPPVDGRANAELIALVAREFRCPRKAITLRSGASGRTKLVQVETGT